MLQHGLCAYACPFGCSAAPQEDQDVDALIAVSQGRLDRLEEQFAELMGWLSLSSAQEP